MEWLKAYKEYLKDEKRAKKKAERGARVKTAGAYIVFAASFILFAGIILLTVNLLQKIQTGGTGKKLIMETAAVSGEATLIRTPLGKNILINAGEEAVDLLKEKQIKKIDRLFITFPYKRNLSGVIYLIKSGVSVSWAGESPHSYKAPHYESFKALCSSYSISVETLAPGQVIEMEPLLKIQVLGPLRSYAEENDNSLVLRMVYDRVAVLFAGEISATAEKDLLNYGTSIRSHILKVANQGKDGSSSPPFVHLLSPETGIISAPMGVTSDFVNGLLQGFHVNLYRNDINGRITVITDGVRYRVKKEI